MNDQFQTGFFKIFGERYPDIVILRPQSDLCKTCQRHYTSGSKLALASEEEKINNVMEMSVHPETVSKERTITVLLSKTPKLNFILTIVRYRIHAL